MHYSAVIVSLVAGAIALGADDKPSIKEIPTKDLKIAIGRGGKATEPTVYKSAEDVAKSPALGGAAEAIKKQVNFDKEKLVAFLWSGSGQDKVTGDLKTADKKTVAAFTYTRGFTRDLRQHARLYVVPKDAEVKVEVGK